MKEIFGLIILIAISCFEITGQNRCLDSLNEILNFAKEDSVKCNIFLELGDEYKKINDDTALIYFFKCLDLSKKNNLANQQATSYRYIGNVYFLRGDLEKALNNHLNALKICEASGDKRGIYACYTNIGNVYAFQENYDRAVEYYSNALKIRESLGDKKGMSECYINIGNVNFLKENYDEALNNYKKSLVIFEELDFKRGISACYNNFGIIYKVNGDFKNAISNYLKSLVIKKELDDKNGIAVVKGNISSLYISLSDSTRSQNLKKVYLDSALYFGKLGYEIALEIKAIPLQRDISAHIQNAYSKLGLYKDALKFANIYIEAQDSMFNQEKTKAVEEIGAKYETEKKQLIIENLNKENALKKAELSQSEEKRKRQMFLIYTFVLGFIIIFIFSIILFRLFVQKKKANILLASQKEHIELQNTRLYHANEEITSQRDTLDEKNKLLEYQNIKITDSITYAKYIQQAVLPSNDQLKNLLKGYFIVFRPKDIVSGDFYWAAKINDTLIITVADCTGHGVPGAIMSMLGISFLNEIVRRQEVRQANHVLNLLRISIIEALNQTGELDEQKDGMDISLIAINTTPQAQTSEGLEPSEVLRAYSAQWAGANNPLWVIRNPKFQDSNSKTQENPDTTWNLEFETCFLELKGDKMPIAIYDRMDDFTNHELQLFTDDMIYLLSDGYEDQSGGPKGKKFLAKNLKQLLIDNCRLSMNEQKEILEKSLTGWIGYGEQIDDITILGIKI